MYGKIGVLSSDQSARREEMMWAFNEHCLDGGADFLEYLKDWHMCDALETINDAAQNNTPERAIKIIKDALDELIAIGADGHRTALEWEGIE